MKISKRRGSLRAWFPGRQFQNGQHRRDSMSSTSVGGLTFGTASHPLLSARKLNFEPCKIYTHAKDPNGDDLPVMGE